MFRLLLSLLLACGGVWPALAAAGRIYVSTLSYGEAGWKFRDVTVRRHAHAKGAEKYLYTDHFPVTAYFDTIAEK